MALRILIIPDKFKGTLTAADAAREIALGWRSLRPEDCLESLPMSDGGDGFGEAMALQMNGERRETQTTNAARECIFAPWWHFPKSQSAVIESAQVVGLAQLPQGKFHPFDLDTFGLGRLLKCVFKTNPHCCWIGLGGTATNDAGFGMARALGWRFLNHRGDEIKDWTQLISLKSVQSPSDQNAFPKNIVAAVDVQNRLLGERGASRIYGAQKGLQPDQIPIAEACLKSLSQEVDRLLGTDFAKHPGAGAAGGLGYACLAFLGAKLQSGFEVFSQKVQLDQRISKADCILTGEGKIDPSSLMGKGVGCIAKLCQVKSKPCIALGGVIEPSPQLCQMFSKLYSIVEIIGDEDAFTKPKQCLRRLARFAATQFRS